MWQEHSDRRSGKDRRRPGAIARVKHERRSEVPRREEDIYWEKAVLFTEDKDA